MRGIQTEVVQGMVDFFSMMIETDETRLDKEVLVLNKCGCGINPLKIGSWILFHKTSVAERKNNKNAGKEIGWAFSVDMRLATVLETLERESSGDGTAYPKQGGEVYEWIKKWNVVRCLGVAREIGVGDDPVSNVRNNSILVALPSVGLSPGGSDKNLVQDAFESLCGVNYE
eukprot:TRINITY_DN6984_c0_g2_i1.p1 TRINITY_DN6984_c0_g2~~TRINITY_DN6984_c0_g2_i1.p1  ORF type:complete len:172 (-),score=39.09 TRINITY_DN6984_c0_g2_i1:25-540(-)